MKRIFKLIFLIPLMLFSQNDTRFSIEYVEEPLYDVFLNIENVYNIRFSFPDYITRDKKLTLKKANRTLETVLNEISKKTNLEFEYINSRYIIIRHLKKDTIAFNETLQEVFIRSYLVNGISKNKDASFKIKPKKLGLLPGLIEPDVLESVQQLPNVISPNETASGFLVRGGSADENRVIWNGINIYHKGHLFGMISPINSNATQTINFYNKGTNPRFGDRISSVIDITTNTKISDSIKFEFGVNAINFDAYLEQPIIKKKLSVQASFRRSYTELLNSYTVNQLARHVFQNTKIDNLQSSNNSFFFRDYSIQINYKPNLKNNISFYTIGIKNDLNYNDLELSQELLFNDALSIENNGYGFNWDTKWNSKIKQKTQAVFSKYNFNYNFITKENNTLLFDFEKRNVIDDYEISTEFEIVNSKKNILALGYQYSLKDVGYAFLNSDPNLTLILDSNDTVIETNAIYGNYTIENLNGIELKLGLRVSNFSLLNAFKFEPRLQINKTLSNSFRIQLTGEIKNQIISEIDETVLSDLSLENKLWRLADGKTFPIINSTQISAGILFKNNGWQVDIDNYIKKIDGKTALSLGYLNPDNSNFNIGNQKIIGSDIFIKKTINPFQVWFSYSFNNIKNEFTEINNGYSFTANTNIKHAINTSLVYQKKQIQFALGWKWHSGKPYTKSTTNAQGTIVFDDINTEVLPNFHRLDFSAMYAFKWNNKQRLKSKFGVSIRNVYNRSSLLSRDYISNNAINNTIQIVDKFSLGFTPNILYRVYW